MMNLNRRSVIAGLSAGLVVSTAGIAPLAAKDDTDSITAILNQIRREHGLQPLVQHNHLRNVALLQSETMAKHNKLKHSIGFGNGFRARMHRVGRCATAAENIAAGQRDAAQVITAWMRSDGHRRNILDPDFSYYGLASASNPNRPDYPYWTLVLSLC